MPRLFAISAIIFLLVSCKTQTAPVTEPAPVDFTESRKQVGLMLDSFNLAAANADFAQYFDYYTDDAIFIGTDATENWKKPDFMVWSKPYFDKGKAWNFTSLQRNIYFNKTGDFGWFDELLKTQMKICRGSGVVVKQGNRWKVQQYVLSMTIPNSEVDPVVKIKAPVEDSLIQVLSGGQ